MWNDRWPMWIERHREKPTIGTNEPYESITIETFQLSKQDGKNRMESLLEKARSEAMLEIEENSTLEIFGTNGQDWYQITTQARRPLESVILNPGIRNGFDQCRAGSLPLRVVRTQAIAKPGQKRRNY